MESLANMENRAQIFLDKLIKKIVADGRNGLNVLVTGHGTQFMAMLFYLQKTGKSDLPKLSKDNLVGLTHNTATSEFKFVVNKDSGNIQKIFVTALNCSSHLDEDLKTK